MSRSLTWGSFQFASNHCTFPAVYIRLQRRPVKKKTLPAKSNALLFFAQRQGGRETDSLFDLRGCAAAILEEALAAFVTSQRADFQTCVSQRLDRSQPCAFGLWGSSQTGRRHVVIYRRASTKPALRHLETFGGGGFRCLEHQSVFYGLQGM